PRPSGVELRDPYEPRSSGPPPRAIDSPPRPASYPLDPDRPASALPASEDERAGIGVNFCQPPLLPVECDVDCDALEVLGLDPEFELLRISEPRSEPTLERSAV